MKHITDDDLTLLFYGEHDDPKLATTVAESEQLSARFDALGAELRMVDNFVPPDRGADYGSDVWQRVSPRLDGTADSGTRPKSWLASVFQPRFSMAGALSMVLVAVLAFMVGQNGGQAPTTESVTAPQVASVALAGIDPKRLLANSVSGHLEQMNIVLTQFVNSSETSAAEVEYATDMLVANRLYRHTATSQGKHQLAAFLASLEPLLIEMAYSAQTGTPTSRERMQREVNNGLLFRVRVMNKQLMKPEITI
jgi:hypothetical protein